MICRQLAGGLLLAMTALAAPPAPAFLVEEGEQRRDYQAALDAARAGNLARFRKLREKLDGYVLRGHLDYELIKDRIVTTPTAELHAYLEDNSQSFLADGVRKKWLRLLAARGDWTTFLAEYRETEDDTELNCLRLNHLLRTADNQAGLMQEIATLWQTGKRLSPACESVFTAWKKAGHMTPERVWERIRLAMDRRQLSLAGELARHLEARDRVWVHRWVAMHQDPVTELTHLRYPVESPMARWVVRHGIVRLAARDPESALSHWARLKERHTFFGEDENYVLRHVGILAAQEQSPQALKLLAAVSADPGDETLHLWRVRTALREGNWEMAKQFLAALPQAAQQEGQWAYWKARAHEGVGESGEAGRIYRTLARTRSYYGFLSADRLNQDYSMQHVSIEATPEEVSRLLARPGIQIARELHALGQPAEARRQWNWLIKRLTNRELAVAAVVAREWGWHDRAILTVAKSDHLDDLDVRFPVLYRELIESNAAEQGLDPGWIYGVVRQESAFVADARSPVGALGLMQLMPATGRLAGRKNKVAVHSSQALLDIQNNLKLGASYLKEVLTRHRGNQTLATAAYNAGPNRVTGWLPATSLDAEIWVETIPFNETRDYVKNVLAYTAVYEHRLGLRPVRLQSRMPPVEPGR